MGKVECITRNKRSSPCSDVCSAITLEGGIFQSFPQIKNLAQTKTSIFTFALQLELITSYLMKDLGNLIPKILNCPRHQLWSGRTMTLMTIRGFHQMTNMITLLMIPIMMMRWMNHRRDEFCDVAFFSTY